MTTTPFHQVFEEQEFLSIEYFPDPESHYSQKVFCCSVTDIPESLHIRIINGNTSTHPDGLSVQKYLITINNFLFTFTDSQIAKSYFNFMISSPIKNITEIHPELFL